MIKCEHIYKSFDGKVVLEDISASFRQGSVNMVIGQSGSGKTVLMKCLSGMLEPDGGEVFYNDTNYTQLGFKERKLLRREIGMLFQGGALLDSSTVEENVRFPLDMFTSMSATEKKDRVDFCLNHVQLNDAHELYPAELSGGMVKRTAIARAIVMNPKYLLCDEPNSGLDPITSAVIDKLIREITLEFNITTIVNTHDMNSVLEIGDQVIFIYKGRKWWQGESSEIFNANNEELNKFVFASTMAKRVKEASERNMK